MRTRPTRSAIVGSIAVATLISTFVIAAGSSPGDRCPEDRDVMVFGPASAGNEPTYEDLSDVVAIVARDAGYDPLTADDLDRIREASAAAIATDASEVETDLPDTEDVVDLRVDIEGSESTGYLVGGGSFCARVSSGDEQD